MRAPITGRVGRRLVAEGNLVNGGSGTQGTLLTTIVSLDPIHAVFSGMLGVTILGLFLTPVFYVTLRKLARRS